MKKIKIKKDYNLTYIGGIRDRLENGARLSKEEQEEIRLFFRDHAISAWGIEDIEVYLEDHDLEDPFDYEQKREILEWCEKNHDATLGINWETLEYTIERYAGACDIQLIKKK